MIAYVTRKLRLTMLRQSSRKSTAKAPTESSAITIKSINGSVMSIVYFQSFCRVYQASGRDYSLYLTVTDYTPFGVLGQTMHFMIKIFEGFLFLLVTKAGEAIESPRLLLSRAET